MKIKTRHLHLGTIFIYARLWYIAVTGQNKVDEAYSLTTSSQLTGMAYRQ
jgi:hypothetical protein